MTKLLNILEKSSIDELVSSLSVLFESNPMKWEGIFCQVKSNALNMKHGKGYANGPNVMSFSAVLSDEINKLRQNPRCYIEHLDAHLEKFKDEYIYSGNNDRLIRTKEGKQGVYEAKSFLDSCKCCDSLLSISSELEMNAKLDSDSFYDSSADNYEPTSLQQRLSNHEYKRGVIIKLTQFGIQDAISLVVSLVIDDGISTRCHREFLFSKDLKYLGAVCGAHSIYDHIINVAMSNTNIFDVSILNTYAVFLSNINQFDNEVRSNILSIPDKGKDIEMLIATELMDGCTVDYEQKCDKIRLMSVKELEHGKQMKQIEFGV